ncbi:MAG: NADH-quinone oxidoreductase subunit M [Actinobacteria bacterium ADurb.BinA094]|nr:MAG: NADH-quinone oxidoreductase subunit M [Actinobacteria bacterium ADurb.BinA094]
MSWNDQIGFPVLSIITFLPLAGVIAILLFGRGRPQVYKVIALVVTLAAFALSVWMLVVFKVSQAGMQLAESVSWIAPLNIRYGMGVDGIAALLVFLTTLLGVVVIIASWHYVKDREMGFFISLLLLEVGMVGVFCATDLFLFYVFWEAMLIPMYFIIGIWGGPRRIYAAIKFFLFTLIGSLLMLLAIIAVVYYVKDHTGTLTFDIQSLSRVVYSYHLQYWAFLAFFVAFAIKVPMFPVHTWLPDAHVEAPTAGSVILAGVLLKMGGYGMLRFCLPFFPDAAVAFVPWVVGLSVIAIIYGALVAMMQKDLKKLVAYSSVSHMGFVTAGIFAGIALVGNAAGVEGAILVMLSHGFLTGALFLMVGFLYERTHTREIAEMGTLGKPLPVLAGFFLFFSFGSLGLPGLSGFVGEFLSLYGVFEYSRWMAAVAAIGVILAAAYLLWMFQRTMYNDRGDDAVRPSFPLKDLGAREIASLVPLVVFVIWLGVYPRTFLEFLHVPVQTILDRVTPSLSDASAGMGALAQLVDSVRGLF